MSFGVAAYPGDGDSVEQLIAEADSALYQAKYLGRNCITTAADIPHSQRVQRAAAQDNAAEEQKFVRIQREKALSETEVQTSAMSDDAAKPEATEASSPALEEAEKQPSALPSPLLWPFVGSTILLGFLATGWGFYPIPYLV
jgi:hypothetical protein